jgi:hypothetical protein
LRRPDKLRGFARPKGLRGPTLINYLVTLWATWRDRRIADFISALYEHGIVDRDTDEFTDKQGPEADAYNQHQKDECLTEIRLRMKQGMSERRACTEVAAEWGFPGNSHEAAAQRLRDLLRSSAK